MGGILRMHRLELHFRTRSFFEYGPATFSHDRPLYDRATGVRLKSENLEDLVAGKVDVAPSFKARWTRTQREPGLLLTSLNFFWMVTFLLTTQLRARKCL